MNRLRVGIVGAGHLGRIHCRLLASLGEAELVGVADPVESARAAVASELGVPIVADYRELIDRIDAAIVVAPTRLHHAIAGELLHAGRHVLVEKPLTRTLAEADELVMLARRRGVVLQVGHVERFNPAVAAVRPTLGEPKYIEAVRTSGFTFRSLDIGAVLDIMIHDIDLCLALVGSEVVDVEALGVTVMGGHEDMAQARLTFANGCVANLTAARVSPVVQRRMHVLSDRGFAVLDFAAGAAHFTRPAAELADGQFDADAISPAERDRLRQELFSSLLPTESLPTAPVNAILEEQREFLHCVRTGAAPTVDALAGRRAIAVAERVLAAIAGHAWDGHAAGRIGPRGLVQPAPVDTPAGLRRAG